MAADEVDEMLLADEMTSTQNELLQMIDARDAALKERDEAVVQRDKALAKVRHFVDSRSGQESCAPLSVAEAFARCNFSATDRTMEEMRRELVKVLAESRRDRVRLSYNLACVYKASRQYEKAEEEFLKALALSPDDPGIHYNLGILYDDNLGDAAKAKVHYETFLELAPRDGDAPRVIQWLKELL